MVKSDRIDHVIRNLESQVLGNLDILEIELRRIIKNEEEKEQAIHIIETMIKKPVRNQIGLLRNIS